MTDTAPRYISNRPLRPARRRPKQVRLENSRLLREIGYLVRNERAKRGMTRKMLAQQANMSERFVAQVELGVGNPSVLSLDAIARALTLDVFDLRTGLMLSQHDFAADCHESPQLRHVLAATRRGDVIVFDRGFVSYANLCLLREAGVLESRKEGKEVYFWINKKRLLEAIETVVEYIRYHA